MQYDHLEVNSVYHTGSTYMRDGSYHKKNYLFNLLELNSLRHAPLFIILHNANVNHCM